MNDIMKTLTELFNTNFIIKIVNKSWSINNSIELNILVLLAIIVFFMVITNNK